MENRDLILTAFVNTVNTTDMSIGITLNVGGQIISGNLISYKRYLQEIADEFGTVNDEHGLGNTLKDLFTSISDEVENLNKEDESVDEYDPSKDANFVHLSDVEIIGTTNVTSKHWRGKLSSVDGFIFGRMQKS